MVYAAPPSVAPSVTLTQGPVHRRTRSHNLSQDGISSAFSSTAPPSLPRRKSARKSFYLEDGGSSPEPTEDQPDGSILSPLVINADVAPFATFPSSGRAAPHMSIPFPRTSGSSTPDVASPRSFSPRPSFSRTPSSPVVLSNGKPLKPSLKSASAPDIPDEVRAHLRARSEPSTPSIKSVHFREEDDLEEVRVYNRAGRPANLLSKPAEETETETEAENAFPFPRTGSPSTPTGVPVPTPQNVLAFEMDMAQNQTSTVPRPSPDVYANVHLESLSLPKTRPAVIRGSILVRNVSFAKNVAVRFTFDNWQTTSEVFCKHVVSLPGLPPPFPRPSTVGDAVGLLAAAGSENAPPTWDRFTFQIGMEDYATKLSDRTLFIVVRYTAPGHGEWWDNNAGQNYRVRFKRSASPLSMAIPAYEPNSSSSVSQQRTFVPPTSVRFTPHSSNAPMPSPIVAPTPLQPRQSAAQAYAASIVKGRPVFGVSTTSPAGSPRHSPNHGSPRISPSGSPSNSDAEGRKRQPRAKPNMGLGLGLGLGMSPTAQGSPAKMSARPPAMVRSMSSPPVYSPSATADTVGSFLVGANSRPTPSSREVDPLMARLSKLSMRNYASPGRSRASSVNENDKPGESVTPPAVTTPAQSVVLAPAPQPVAEEDIVQQAADSTPASVSVSPVDLHMKAPSPSPITSSEHSPDNGSDASSTNSSACSSPLPGTPRIMSLDNFDSLPKFSDTWTEKNSPAHENGSGSDSDASRSSAATIKRVTRTTDLVLNMPSPTSRGAINSPFSPISTPRFHIGDPGVLNSGAGGRMSPMHSRVGTGDADYAAFVRNFCFARSPSPTHGTPLGENMPATPASPANLPGPLQPAPPTPHAQTAAITVKVRMSHKGGSPMQASPRSSPHGSVGASPAESPTSERPSWLGMGDGYGLGVGMQASKA